MEALKQYQVQYDEFKAHFQTVSHGSNISYGDYQIMRNVMTGQAVLVKPQETLSLEETEELLTTISDINIPLNQCDHFVQFLGFTEVPFEERQAEGLPISVDENGQTAATSNMIYLVFEHFEDQLESIWSDLARNTENNQKIEDLLLNLARSLTESFEKLEEIGQAHTDVSLQNILAFKSSQDNLTHFKLIYSQYTTSAFRQVIDLHQSPENYFLAPELIERLNGQAQQLSQSYSGLDPQKIDIYAFGKMLLFLAAFKDPQITMAMKGKLIEDDNDGSGEQQFSQQLKDIVKGGYSEEFWELIQAMTDIEIAKRPNLQQISESLSNISLVKSSKCKNK